MVDPNKEDYFDYSIVVYRHNNQINVTDTTIDELYATNYPGTYEMYLNNDAIPGVYYVKVFSFDGTYSNRFSYRLSYFIQFENKLSLNLDTYCQQNPNSFIVWCSDYNINDEKFIINKRGEFFCDTYNYNYPNDLIEDIWELGQFLNFEIYVWGIEFRNELFNYINTFYNNLNYVKNLWITDIQNGKRVTQNMFFLENGVNVVVELITVDGIVEDSLNFTINYSIPLVFNIFKMFLLNDYEYDFDALNMRLLYFEILKSSLSTGVGTSQNEVICLSHISKLVHKNYPSSGLGLGIFTEF